eukprot:gene17861-5621_t
MQILKIRAQRVREKVAKRAAEKLEKEERKRLERVRKREEKKRAKEQEKIDRKHALYLELGFVVEREAEEGQGDAAAKDGILLAEGREVAEAQVEELKTGEYNAEKIRNLFDKVDRNHD